MYKLVLVFFVSLFVVGCASVEMADAESDKKAKEFLEPAEGKSNLYVYRPSFFGAALKKTIWLDDECLGRSAPMVFFLKEVDGDTTHRISTESEFSPNDLLVEVKAGVNYFIRQYIKIGVFVGGADLELVDEEVGMTEVRNLNLAKVGNCS